MLHSERTLGFTTDPDYWKGEVFVYVGRNQNLKDLKERMQGFAADPDYWKGEVFAYVGLPQNQKDLKEPKDLVCEKKQSYGGVGCVVKRWGRVASWWDCLRGLPLTHG